MWGLTPLALPQLTFVDFLAYDVLDQQRMFVPQCPELQGNLAQFLQRFEVSGAGTARGHRGVPAPAPSLTLGVTIPQPAVPSPSPTVIVTIPDT